MAVHAEPRISNENEYYVKLYSELSKAEAELCDKHLPKRQDCISWDEFYMSVAFLSSMRSKDPNTHVKYVGIFTRIANLFYLAT